jgi:regulator of replication initiation timing
VAKINSKAPGISMSGDINILQTNTSRAVKEIHNNIMLLEEENRELRVLLEELSKRVPTTEGEAQEETKTEESTEGL